MSEQQSSSSSEIVNNTGKQVSTGEEDQLINPFIDFECHVCQMREKTLYGELKVSDGQYHFPVYFLRDPFNPPSRDKAKKPRLDDFLILGASCSACNQPVCMSDGCSLFFGSNFCAPCICRERRRFPPQLIRGTIAKYEAQKK